MKVLVETAPVSGPTSVGITMSLSRHADDRKDVLFALRASRTDASASASRDCDRGGLLPEGGMSDRIHD